MSGNERLLKPAYGPDTSPRLEFADGQFRFRSVNQEGAIVERFISSSAVREAFSRIPIDSGWLPPQIVRWGNGRVGEWVVAFIPPGVHELELTQEPGLNTEWKETTNVDRIRAPLPGLVLFGHSNQYFIWAVKTERLDPYQEIYRCPLPNVEETGLICWGPFKPPRATPKRISEAFDLFIKSTFNNHRANGKSKANRDDVRIMLRELAQVQLAADQFSIDARPSLVEALEQSDVHDLINLGMKYHALPMSEKTLNDTAIRMEQAVENLQSKLVEELIEAGRRAAPSAGYPVKDLERQVQGTGVTLDQAIRQYFEGGGMPQ